MEKLSPELRALVKDSVALLGRVIEQELGRAGFLRIESLRREMAGLRGRPSNRQSLVLRRALARLRRLDRPDRLAIAHSFTLMLELMNACENAYRTVALRRKKRQPPGRRPHPIVYVLTAHPTEARSPQNIAIFHALQQTLGAALEEGFSPQAAKLQHLLSLAWRIRPFRGRKPQVSDEAEHIFSLVLRKEALDLILEANESIGPFLLRTWVGGDRDGHPGVSAATVHESLALSRCHLGAYIDGLLLEVRGTLELLEDAPPAVVSSLSGVQKCLKSVRSLSRADGDRILRLRAATSRLCLAYQEAFKTLHPALRRLELLLAAFPALVLPLELRDSSEKFEGSEASHGEILNMLQLLKRLAGKAPPLWYVRGLIVSMTRNALDLRNAARVVKLGLGAPAIPVIPLFETRASLENAAKIAEETARDPAFRRASRKYWNGLFEVMLGYSDSSKESGVLLSRLKIADALKDLDRVIRAAGLKPVTFHGSGGSVDRGGGSFEEQTSWWPASARQLYKATIQGEMIERSFASPEIAWSQLLRIAEQAGQTGKGKSGTSLASRPVVARFVERASSGYVGLVHESEFRDLVMAASPYPYLNLLHMGSRPAKRVKKSPAGDAPAPVESLRAIPWVLCWTQTRVLLPTWWGIGSAWRQTPPEDRAKLVRCFREDPLLRSVVKAFGFTLAKVELPIWRLYLERSGLPPRDIEAHCARFEGEFAEACRFVRAISGKRDLLWFRPWLGTSIQLRAPMIHPLNLLQLLGMHDHDAELMRETVTGVASGMLTTG